MPTPSFRVSLAGLSLIRAPEGPAPSTSSIYSQDRYSWTSSVYSQDEPLPAPAEDKKPLLLQRADTDLSATSSAKTLLTIYDAETIKSLGYKPFEYWKGPKPTAYPVDFRKQKTNAAKPSRPKTPRISILKSSSASSNIALKPIPHVRVRELKGYMDAEDTPPRTPTIKERYRQRQAERAKRRRDLVHGGGNWPGWVPDKKVHMKKQQQQQQQQHRKWTRIIGDEKREKLEEWDLEKRQSTGSTVFVNRIERWWDPLMWRRRIWGILGILLVLLTAGGLIAAMVSSKANLDGPVLKYRTSDYHLTRALVTEGLRVPSSPP
ncbi:hypothetical protein M406DRAFT_67320 [Cryphonectria parasitica EP155]|uniref:Uncharacterized protein n=1 Tax=Cryphonectria parasitica (strain ATCC 38755 / EP155) TaxID=660469 RepID=A0A9P5CUX5_CRYP1|nr:uncharacterized protein M406DRAFT_67320 [Cryphonectria parasitica EP155]KAF3770972.1 hypothetical protein M406DRAFT_67320 [Cryphonectria parasitica EP155]